MRKYDYLIVGAGLFGAVFAAKAMARGKRVLVIDKREHVGGNLYTYVKNKICVHKYGAHIFHTDNKEVWDFVNMYAEFNEYVHTVVAKHKFDMYSLPFNMYTFNKVFGATEPHIANAIIEEERKEICGEPKNLEEQAIKLVGRTIYERLVKGYTEKQWGRDCKDLPPFIIKRLPMRMTYDNRYFSSRYQGIPTDGYTQMIRRMLLGADVYTGISFFDYPIEYWNSIADNIVYTGPIDEFFGYKYGKLEYRTVEFKTKCLGCDNHQGAAVVNYVDNALPYTRIIEHKWFTFGKGMDGEDIKGTIITEERSKKTEDGDEPYYPINDEKNNELYEKYKKDADRLQNVIFGGRLGEYKYLDMDKTVESALKCANASLARKTECF